MAQKLSNNNGHLSPLMNVILVTEQKWCNDITTLASVAHFNQALINVLCVWFICDMFMSLLYLSSAVVVVVVVVEVVVVVTVVVVIDEKEAIKKKIVTSGKCWWNAMWDTTHIEISA